MLRKPPILVTALLVVDAVLVVAYLADATAGRPWRSLTRFLDLDAEDNLPTWYSSMQWMLCGAIFAVFAWRNARWTVRSSWSLWLLPLLFAGLSLDEVAQVHEWLGRRTDVLLKGGTRYTSAFPVSGIWMFVIGVPFIVVLAVIVNGVRPYFAGALRALWLTCLGMAVMLAGAIGVETLSNFVVAGSVWATIEVAVEECLEMVGSTIVAWGGIELLAVHGFSLQMDAAIPEPARETTTHRGNPAGMDQDGPKGLPDVPA